jgi:CTP:molybdopterin cytidylyltransferase MocA
MHLIVPMAGLGQRFRDEGYALPKPLIDVSGTPMVVRAVRDLPPCERMTFLVHPDHAREHAIDRRLREFFPSATVIATPGLTAGQACTVRLASSAVDEDEEVLVAACDNSHVYDAEKFAALRSDPAIDAILWTYRHDPRVLVRPTAHGWVECSPPLRGRTDSPRDDRERAGSISQPAAGKIEVNLQNVSCRGAADDIDVARVWCKVPISQTPLNDHAISGCFWFRRAGELFQAIDELVAKSERVNNEFYLDQVPNLYVQAGRRAAVFEVEKYIGWGTPHDHRDYQAWERYFESRSRLPSGTWRAA